MIRNIGLFAFSIILVARADHVLSFYGGIEAAASPVVDYASHGVLNGSTGLSRREGSRDPSCPDGYLCNLNTPCDDSLCSSDRHCIAFDGFNGCVRRDQDVTLCRVNLSIGAYEICSKAGATCCHGNCLAPGNVCCTFEGVKCGASETNCQQCGPGTTCGTESCIPLSSSSTIDATITAPTTVSATTAETATTTMPNAVSTTVSTSMDATESHSTSTTTAPINSNSGLTTTTVSEASTTLLGGSSSDATTGSTSIDHTNSISLSVSPTTSIAPTPTIAPQADKFKFGGCFVDSSDARILVADSTEDGSEDGMTVEKCVAFASDGAWKYAGVEFGSQCFVGNTLHGQDKYPDSDCNTPCAGDLTEICGDGGRIQVYEDPTWSDPTLEELAGAVRQYASVVDDVRSLTVNYRATLVNLQDYISSVKAKRDEGNGLDDIQRAMLEHQRKFTEYQTTTQTVRKTSDRILLQGEQRDTPYSANPKVPGTIATKWDFTKLEQQINEAKENCEYNVAAIEIARTGGTVPQVDTALSIAQADAMIKLIGLGLVSAAVGTFLWALGEILSFFGGDTSSSPEPGTATTVMPTTSIPTGSTTPSTTTTSCTATAITTPVGILAKQGISLVEFSELVAGLPQDSGSIQLTDSWQPNYLYIGNIDECTADLLNTNPLVARWDYASVSQPVFVINENGIPECKL